jgi:hypothetical protein
MSKINKMLKYKDMLFDDFVVDEYGTWATICEKCAEKHKNILPYGKVTFDGGGVCGVCGCNESDEFTEIEIGYIDFEDGEFEIVEVIEVNEVK